MHQAETGNLTAAVIDHALHDGSTTSEVCAKLKERDIPFIVYSGFSKLEGACADGELVHKPASPAMLLATLQGVLAAPPKLTDRLWQAGTARLATVRHPA